MKGKCIRACGSKKPLEERNKVIYVSKRFARQRETMEERISTYEGKLIRVNRSIQAEGVFAMTKEDMGFRRFLLRSAVKVEVEWTLLSLAYNVLKLHHKIQKGGCSITRQLNMEKPSGSAAFLWYSLDGFSHFRWQLCFVKPCFPQSTPIQRGAASQ